MSSQPPPEGGPNRPSFAEENAMKIASESLQHYDQASDTYHVSYGLQHLKWIVDNCPERKEQLHLALEEAENFTLNQFDSALFEAMIVLAGKGTKPEQIKKGIEIVGMLQVKQVEEYFHRLRRAGFEERIERSKFKDMLAQIALLQRGAATGAASA